MPYAAFLNGQFSPTQAEFGGPYALQTTELSKGLPLIWVASSGASAPVVVIPSNSQRRALKISNISTDPVAIGYDDSVTYATGFIIPSNQIIDLDRHFGAVWAINDTAKTSTVTAWETTTS